MEPNVERLTVVTFSQRIMGELMPYLYDRWQDEHEFEDIEDYRLRVENFANNVMPGILEIVQMHKRPFGFTFKVEQSTFRLTMNGRSYKCVKV